MVDSRPAKTEEDRLVNWGWGLGLVLPIVGLMVAAVLVSRGDSRWPWMVGWALLGVLIYSLVFNSI